MDITESLFQLLISKYGMAPEEAYRRARSMAESQAFSDVLRSSLPGTGAVPPTPARATAPYRAGAGPSGPAPLKVDGVDIPLQRPIDVGILSAIPVDTARKTGDKPKSKDGPKVRDLARGLPQGTSRGPYSGGY